MGDYRATVEWRRGGDAFTDNRYSRWHRWRFDGGIEVPASASPHVVPQPMSVAGAVDPEEALVAALASCHLLSFLFVAAKRKYLVESYRDEAVGVMTKADDGKYWVSRVTLRPDVRFGGDVRPTAEEAAAMHHEAHEECYIARSVRTDVRCEPV